MNLPHHRIGELVRVKHCQYGYPLPEGLPDGATVKLLSFDCGYFKVEHNGRTFEIFMACVDESPTIA